ncbi:hypothetical protein BC628DRAFT_1409554 [Trametes gibbosa]|nr:hypothetical protein BC628DRAFT_1409554 [Trametes gibbosa]
MSAPTFLAQQPRWVILSAFLFLWSVSSGFRRDGRALGLGVEARVQNPDAHVMVDMQAEYAPDAVQKRQVGIPTCAAVCASQAGAAVGCGEALNLPCAYTVNCMDVDCTTKDKQQGQQALQSACLMVGTSTTSASPTSTSFSVSRTSITSGPPPICTTVSPTPSSGFTTVSVTVTATVTESGSGSMSAPSSTAPASSTALSDSTSSSVPVTVVTTTTSITSSGTVLVPPSSSATPPTTVITSTSTIGGIPSGTGSGGGGQNGAAGGFRGGCSVLLAALCGMGALMMV